MSPSAFLKTLLFNICKAQPKPHSITSAGPIKKQFAAKPSPCLMSVQEILAANAMKPGYLYNPG